MIYREVPFMLTLIQEQFHNAFTFLLKAIYYLEVDNGSALQVSNANFRIRCPIMKASDIS